MLIVEYRDNFTLYYTYSLMLDYQALTHRRKYCTASASLTRVRDRLNYYLLQLIHPRDKWRGHNVYYICHPISCLIYLISSQQQIKSVNFTNTKFGSVVYKKNITSNYLLTGYFLRGTFKLTAIP